MLRYVLSLMVFISQPLDGKLHNDLGPGSSTEALACYTAQRHRDSGGENSNQAGD